MSASAQIRFTMEPMTEAHRRCDLLLAAAEQALESGEWQAFRVRIVEFRSALLEHFAILTFCARRVLNGPVRGVPTAASLWPSAKGIEMSQRALSACGLPLSCDVLP